ncbi:Plant transposase (Ptta/En/Spm family) [Carex littledalei]|uniref:Plant transposase (Ptta/En/Spm family) n=1 Tax=Carex littledalei TaxID=544730 RepID=A0A833RK91_9POAL|nr:Plant transposase (Ptta/En/Spm family) [Carex littledalei]
MNPKWEQFSNINRANKTGSSSTGDKRAVSHVGGSRSSYRHKQKLIVEKGGVVGLQDVFDRTHMKRSSAGEYISDRAKRAADRFKSLKEAHGNEMDDEALWKLAVDGEDKRGRLYGFGNWSRMSKGNQELEAMEASPSEPTKSTATSAEHTKKSYTAEEVEELIKRNLDAAQRGFAQEIAAQEMRHRVEMEENKKENAYSKACIAALFAKTGADPPNFSEVVTNVQSSSGGGVISEGEGTLLVAVGAIKDADDLWKARPLVLCHL